MATSSGFAAGLVAGTVASNSWIKTYKMAKEKKLEDSMYEAATQLSNGYKQVDEEGNAIEQEAIDLATMDPGKLTNMILERAAQNGVKINDDVYKVAWGVGTQLGGMQQKYQLFRDKKEKLDIATSNIYDQIQTRRAKLAAKFRPVDSNGVPVGSNVKSRPKLTRYDKGLMHEDPTLVTQASEAYYQANGEPVPDSRTLTKAITNVTSAKASNAGKLFKKGTPKKKNTTEAKTKTKPSWKDYL